MADQMKIRTYKGVNIHPCRRTLAGMRWWALLNGRTLHADTLDGIKTLITAEVGHG